MTTLAKLQTLYLCRDCPFIRRYNCNIDYEESTDQLHVTTNTTGLYVDIQLPRGYPQVCHSFSFKKPLVLLPNSYLKD